ncbi:MAG: TetR family transcriptional regulator [Clostridia bacterium]|nr:TetR family transcriptional regulator [Clostridia bacterium]
MKKSDITKQKIMAAAEESFAKKGLYGSRVDEIAEMGGINKRMIYEHFGSKESLYVVILDTVYLRLAEREKELMLSSLSPKEAIKTVIDHYFTFLSENESFIKMVMWENINEAVYLKESAAANIKGSAIELMKSKIEKGIKLGEFKENLDTTKVVVLINMICFSCFSNIYTMSHIMNEDFKSEKELSEYKKIVTDMIFSYIER